MDLILNVVIILVLLMYVSQSLKRLLKKTSSPFYKSYFILFVIVHFGVSFLFAFFLEKLTMIKDPHDFYNGALRGGNWLQTFGIGHAFMKFLIYPFVQLKVSIEVLFLVFSTISFKGFLIYFELLEVHKFKLKKKIFLLLFFLIPSIHFWTGFLGKDPLLFYLMALILKKVHGDELDIYLTLLLIPVFLIRPHVCFILIITLFILLILDKRKSSLFKRNLLISTVVIFGSLIPVFFLFFLKTENLSFTSLVDYYYSFVQYTIDKGNTSINILETSLAERIFYLALMPLPFLYPFKNEFIFIISIENIYYLVVFIVGIKYCIQNKFNNRKFSSDNKFALIAGILLIILFASYLYNIGLGNRMRIMFYPYLFYFFIRNSTYKENFKTI